VAEALALAALLFVGSCAVGVVLAIVWIGRQELEDFERFVRDEGDGKLGDRKLGEDDVWPR